MREQTDSTAVGRQVLFTFGTLCAIILVIGGLFFFSLKTIERGNAAQQSRSLNKLALIDDAAQDVGQMQAETLRQVLKAGIGQPKSDQAVREIERINARELVDYGKTVDTPAESQLYDRVMQARKVFWERTQSLFALEPAGKEAGFIDSTQAPAYDGAIKAINELIACVETDADKIAGKTKHFISRMRMIGNALICAALLMVVRTGLAVVGITRRLRVDNGILQTKIEESRLAGEELRFNAAFLEAQVNSSMDGILVVDEHGKKILQNPRVAALLKVPSHIAGDQDDEKQLRWVSETTKAPAQFIEKVIHLNSHPNEISFDEIELKNGMILDRHSSPVVGKDGKYYGRIWTFRDVTERKRLEAQLFQSQKMETVGKLAGGVAHEFNSILTAIIGQSELMRSDLPAESPLIGNATEISKAAGRAAALTRQLLAYGRKQFLQPEALDLDQIVAGMEGMFHNIMGGDVDTHIVSTPGLHAVKADAGQIEQVIMNMAINARDAMPNGGKLTFETANVSFDEESVGRYPELKAGDYVMLAITDTGTGMSAETKARIFEPFFSTKGVGQGTGLGLSTCYGIVKQSGGHISVYSELARGATFKIYLPQAERQAEIPVTRLDSPDLPRGTETILLVEDDPALREMAATLLRRLGYTVLAAADGVEALGLKQRRGVGYIDLLFTDVVMPHMSGKELSERVRALNPHTRILFTSAYTENAIVHQGVLDKGVALLQKPFTPSSLAHKLREVLDRVIAS